MNKNGTYLRSIGSSGLPSPWMLERGPGLGSWRSVLKSWSRHPWDELHHDPWLGGRGDTPAE